MQGVLWRVKMKKIWGISSLAQRVWDWWKRFLHAGEERGCRRHHYSSDERYMHFTATFNEGTVNVPMLISCQTNYSNITGFVLLIANISCLIDSQRAILPAAFHHSCEMLSTWALPTAWVPATYRGCSASTTLWGMEWVPTVLQSWRFCFWRKIKLNMVT